MQLLNFLHMPDMAGALDQLVDVVIEKFGVQYGGFIRQ
jgi:hypothetical protein